MVGAVIFDLDGVIVDTETPEYLAWKTLYARHGWEFPLDLWLQNIGRVDSPFDALEPFRRPGSPLSPEEALALWREIRAALEPGYLTPLPGVVRLVEALRARGLPRAVASSSRTARVHGLLAALRLDDKFDAVACGDEVAHAKPWPDVYLLAAQRVGARPTACVALEDSVNGLRAAKAAGMRCIAVPSALTRRLDFSPADLVVESLCEVTPDVIAAVASG
jgi:HAD superfamily hydrolase (TIGR01509 family)